MERHGQLLLEIWREVCRHLEIQDAVTRLVPLLAQRSPAEALFVRRLDVQRSLVETVATGICHDRPSSSKPRTDCSTDTMEQILIWSEAKRILQLHSSRFPAQLAPLVPEGAEGEILAGPLRAAEGAAGVLVMMSLKGFRKEHVELFEALLEPFAVALENDHRVRELNVLREALEADNRSLLSRLGRHDISESIVGADTGLKPVMTQIELVARSNAPVLLLGETGSGKEVVARAIHTRSVRAAKPFLRVNCGALPGELVDSELFGHERGSFTGATNVRKGWFERADGGTLFLDECGELPLAAQVRLLRILQDGTFERVGGERQMNCDVRIIAATHRDLPSMVAAGRFREDLWYRVAVFPIRLPPLRERIEDIPMLATHFALRAASRLGSPALVPTPEDLDLLVAYSWPGNVRELAAVIERAAILGDGKRLEVAKALGVVGPQAVPVSSPGPIARRGQGRSQAAHAGRGHGQAHRIGSPARPAAESRALMERRCFCRSIRTHSAPALRKLGITWNRYRHSAGTAPAAVPGNGRE